MKKIQGFLAFMIAFILASCSYSDSLAPSLSVEGASGGGQGDQSGLITAGEWNDLENWDFWTDLLQGDEHGDHPAHWDIYPTNRVSVLLTNGAEPLIDARVELFHNGNRLWETRSDNHGKAELWIDLFERNGSFDPAALSLSINGNSINTEVKLYQDGVNEIQVNDHSSHFNRVDLAFIVDATGSMGDELEFLKDDLEDVIDRVQTNNASVNVRTGSVFYRDKGDKYVVRESQFTEDLSETIDFIRKQKADGGGDFPEAVHSALETAMEELKWSNEAKTRIAFLLLDAPPHHEPKVLKSLQESVEEAARQGIKIIPITASGIDKQTEFLMRFFSIATNSTYVFITNHSGIGDEHLEPTVGEYEVEYLNDLMVRLIGEYAE